MVRSSPVQVQRGYNVKTDNTGVKFVTMKKYILKLIDDDINRLIRSIQSLRNFRPSSACPEATDDQIARQTAKLERAKKYRAKYLTLAKK